MMLKTRETQTRLGEAIYGGAYWIAVAAAVAYSVFALLSDQSWIRVLTVYFSLVMVFGLGRAALYLLAGR